MGVTFFRKPHVFKCVRAKSKLLFNVFKVLPSKHRKPHAWIHEQRSKSAHLPEPTHAGTKYPRSGEPLTPICIFSVARHRKNIYLFCGAPQKKHLFVLWRATEKHTCIFSVARHRKNTCVLFCGAPHKKDMYF